MAGIRQIVKEAGMRYGSSWATTTEPKVSVGETGVHNEQTGCISLSNYLPGVHNEQTGWKTVARGLQAIDVAAYVITAKAPQKETT